MRKNLSEISKGGDQFGDIGVDRSIILERFVKEAGVRVWNGFIWFRMGSSGGDELSGSK
jgi:hypothetical protein